MDDDLFIAVFQEKIPHEIAERAEENSRTYRLADNLLLISLPDSGAASVVDMLMPDFDETDEPDVVVILKLNGSYSGYQKKRLWEWLDDSKEAGT